MKQKIVIKVSMPCEKSRSKAMALAARESGVSSMGITGDDKDRLEVVGDDVDSVCLVRCLRRKLGHAEILQVEEVKEKKPEEKSRSLRSCIHCRNATPVTTTRRRWSSTTSRALAPSCKRGSILPKFCKQLQRVHRY